MLDYNELSKYFNDQQRKDMIALDILCMQTPPGRIRRARVRKIKPDHIPRPVNSFMAYRTEKQSIIRQFCPTANHRDISKMVAKWWHNVGSSEKSIFVDRAKAAKDAHNEQYPNYTFRPRAKRFDKKVTLKKRDSVVIDKISVTNEENYSTSARARVFTKPATVKSHVSPPNDPYYDCSTPIETNMMFNSEPIQTNMMYNTAYDNMLYNNNNNNNNNDMYNNAMYNDDVLFKSGENSGFWNNNNYQSSEQIMSNSYPSLIGPPQINYYVVPPMYYTSPEAPGLSPTSLVQDVSHTIDPMVTILPSPNPYSSFNHGNAGYLNAEGQLFPRFDCKVTPQSQAMSTPRLGYPSSPLSPAILGYASSPFSPAIEGSAVFDRKVHENSLPTAILSPSVTSNGEYMSSWSNHVKYENNNNLLGDCDFWGNAIN